MPGPRDVGISGTWVAWLDCRRCVRVNGLPGYRGAIIYVKNLASGRQFAVASHDNPESLAIGGNTLVWMAPRTQGSAIFGEDLASGHEFTVAAGPDWKTAPAISGHLVVWQQTRQGGTDIMGRDLAQGRTFVVAAHSQRETSLRDPVTSANTIIWTAGAADQSVSIEGKNLAGGGRFVVATIPSGRFNPQVGPHVAISGRIVVWDEALTSSPSGVARLSIFGVNLGTGRRFRVAQGMYSAETPAVSGKTIVWVVAHRQRSSDIYGAIFSRDT